MTSSRFAGTWLPWLLLLPTLGVLALFLYYPIVNTFAMSVYEVAFLGLARTFVGLANYADLFHSPEYLASVRVTLLFSTGVVVGGLVISLALALLANQKVRGARAYRLFLIWPYALSPAVAGTIWLFLFNPAAGIINYLSDVLLGVKPNWLTDPSLALVLVTAAAIWKNLGYNVVFYLAGLQNIPGELLEAAAIDGASAWRRLRSVTLPLLSPMTFFLVIMNLIYAFFDTFGMVDLMTRGGPVGATNILIFNLYRDGFEYLKTGLAAAQSVILFALVMALTAAYFRVGGRRVHYGA